MTTVRHSPVGPRADLADDGPLRLRPRQVPGAALHDGRRTTPVVLVAVWTLAVTAFAAAQAWSRFTYLPAVLVLLAALLVTGYAADTTRLRRALADGERRRADEERRRAVLEERARIARELHDLVTQRVSAVAARAEIGPAGMPGLPEVARAHYAQTGLAAREALTELRRLLGVLGNTDGAPQPTLADLDHLVDGMRRAGMPVSLRVLGPAAVPAGIGLGVYRIAQEALSNVLRHAAGAPTRVELTHTPTELLLRVANDPPAGPRPAVTAVTHGHGLLGMRERAALLGGSLTAAPTADGGYLVEAAIPLPSA